MDGFSARGSARGQGAAAVRHAEGHGVDVDKGESIEILLVRVVLVVFLGGLPVKAFYNEDILEGVLSDHQEGVGEVERADSIPWCAGYNGHNGVVRNSILAQGCAHQQGHVQRPGWVLVPIHVSLVKPVDDRATDANERHQAQTNNVENVVHGECLALLAGIIDGIYLHLIKNEDSQTTHQNEEAQHDAYKEGPSEEPEFQALNVVGVVVYEASNVLPHDVDHGRGKETVLNVEGVQPKVAILEDLADLTVAAAFFS